MTVNIVYAVLISLGCIHIKIICTNLCVVSVLSLIKESLSTYNCHVA